ncbi:hypothetical protein ACHAWF_006462 [Thalassiosira exigua]
MRRGDPDDVDSNTRKRRRSGHSTSPQCSRHNDCRGHGRIKMPLWGTLLCVGHTVSVALTIPGPCHILQRKGSSLSIRAGRIAHRKHVESARPYHFLPLRGSTSETPFHGEFDPYSDEDDDTTGAKIGGEENEDVDADEYFGRFISDAFMEDEAVRDEMQAESSSNSNQFDTSEAGDDSTLEETKRMMEHQQKQIDLLMKLVQGQQQPPSSDGTRSISTPVSPPPPAHTLLPRQNTINVAPLKAMLFIDGTWLYYSLNTRGNNRDVIIPKFGRGWQNNFKVDWQALPRIICSEIEKQRNSKASFTGSNRPLEIARAMVFTSAKKDTDPNSIRMRMFRDMANANYDVHMMETVGQGEKCVDIQLAVEMLHFATVPNAYDVAILLSGDKDFVPALVRTRQKGKQVCIASMRAGCNSVLYESPHIRDYDVVWLENCLDELIVPISDEERSHRDRAGYASAFTIMRVIRDFVQADPDHEWVSSRDIGRYLKSIQIGPDSQMLDELKSTFGGLRTFVGERACELFDVKFPEAGAIRGPGEFGFWVRMKGGDSGEGDLALLNEFKKTKFFTKEEKEFLERYKKQNYIDVDDAYDHTTMAANFMDAVNTGNTVEQTCDSKSENQSNSPPTNYSQLTIVKLREICREKGLPVSGKKDILIDRLEEDRKRKVVVEPKPSDRSSPSVRHRATKSETTGLGQALDGTQPGNIYSATLPQMDATKYRSSQVKGSAPADHAVTARLEALIIEYLTASGGMAGSRDIGRYLAANSDSRRGNQSALTELKETYGSLLSFINSRQGAFDVMYEKTEYDKDGVMIKLIKQPA